MLVHTSVVADGPRNRDSPPSAMVSVPNISNRSSSIPLDVASGIEGSLERTFRELISTNNGWGKEL